MFTKLARGVQHLRVHSRRAVHSHRWQLCRIAYQEHTAALSGIDVRTFGSQGQKRTAALSLKLSELAFIREIKEEAPVLILDDVLSELDEGRQQLLMESMKDCQCFLTCTSLEGLKRAGLGNMKVFRCKGGEMRPE